MKPSTYCCIQMTELFSDGMSNQIPILPRQSNFPFSFFLCSSRRTSFQFCYMCGMDECIVCADHVPERRKCMHIGIKQSCTFNVFTPLDLDSWMVQAGIWTQTSYGSNRKSKTLCPVLSQVQTTQVRTLWLIGYEIIFYFVVRLFVPQFPYCFIRYRRVSRLPSCSYEWWAKPDASWGQYSLSVYMDFVYVNSLPRENPYLNPLCQPHNS